MKRRNIALVSFGAAGVFAAVAVWAIAGPAVVTRAVVTRAVVTRAVATTAVATSGNQRSVDTDTTQARTLLTQSGEPFSFEQLKGKTVVLNFIFTHCPSVCPTQTKALTRVQKGLPDALRDRVHFVSVSIDPERDTPGALREFASGLDVDLSNWTLVTGPRGQIEALNQRYAVQKLPEGAAVLDHRADVRLINASGRPVQTYGGNPLDEARLVREIQTVDRLFNQRTADQAGAQL